MFQYLFLNFQDYNINSDSSTITLVKGEAGYTSIVIPSNVVYNEKTYTVSEIGASAFIGQEILTAVTIYEGVKKIGDRAFMGCLRSSALYIPNSTKYIGRNAFYNCTSLPSITIPESVTEIGRFAFSNLII